MTNRDITYRRAAYDHHLTGWQMTNTEAAMRDVARLCHDARDEIDRLRDQVGELRSACRELSEHDRALASQMTRDELVAELCKLRAKVDRVLSVVESND